MKVFGESFSPGVNCERMTELSRAWMENMRLETENLLYRNR